MWSQKTISQKTKDFIGYYLNVSPSKDKIVNKGTENKKSLSGKGQCEFKFSIKIWWSCDSL